MQCRFTQQDAKDEKSRWNCQNPEHPVGDDGQQGHAAPPNGAIGTGLWGIGWPTIVRITRAADGTVETVKAVQVGDMRVLYDPPINIRAGDTVEGLFTIATEMRAVEAGAVRAD